MDIGKQQQLNDKSDRHENGAKTTAVVQLVTLVASATILAPLDPRPFDERFSDVIALLSERLSANVRRGYPGTYMHLGRKAAPMQAS